MLPIGPTPRVERTGHSQSRGPQGCAWGYKARKSSTDKPAPRRIARKVPSGIEPA